MVEAGLVVEDFTGVDRTEEASPAEDIGGADFRAVDIGADRSADTIQEASVRLAGATRADTALRLGADTLAACAADRHSGGPVIVHGPQKDAAFAILLPDGIPFSADPIQVA